MIEEATKIEIVRLLVSYKDKSFLRRMQKLYEIANYRLPSEKGGTRLFEAETTNMMENMKKDGVPTDMVEEINRHITAFTKNLDKISIKLEPVRPVRLSDIIGKKMGSTLVLLNPSIDT